jgi:hypothetical protein
MARTILENVPFSEGGIAFKTGKRKIKGPRDHKEQERRNGKRDR